MGIDIIEGRSFSQDNEESIEVLVNEAACARWKWMQIGAKTDDGTYIHVRNKGIIYQGKDEQGKPSFYFKAAPKFEAPYDSNYAWLNHAIYVCSPDFSSSFKGIVLNVWMVR